MTDNNDTPDGTIELWQASPDAGHEVLSSLYTSMRGLRNLLKGTGRRIDVQTYDVLQPTFSLSDAANRLASRPTVVLLLITPALLLNEDLLGPTMANLARRSKAEGSNLVVKPVCCLPVDMEIEYPWNCLSWDNAPASEFRPLPVSSEPDIGSACVRISRNVRMAIERMVPKK